MKKIKTGLVWFRNNLRMDDNPALNRALKMCEYVILVHIYDTRIFEKKQFDIDRIAGHRMRFLFQSVEDLTQKLRDNDLYLHTAYDEPISYIKKLVNQYRITDIFTQKEVGHEESIDEKAIKRMANLHLFESSTLFCEADLGFAIDELPKDFTSFRKKVEKRGFLNPPVDFERHCAFSIEIPDEKYLHKFSHLMINPHKKTVYPFTGGETMGNERLKKFIWDDHAIDTYKNTRNNLIGSNYSSKFSPWLANGSLSPKRIWLEISQYEQIVNKNQSTYWLKFELLWREFFKWMAFKYPAKYYLKNGFSQKPLDRVTENENFILWKKGNTVNEFINANMNELNLTGFMSNRGRQIVASYLIYDLHVDWRLGASYFEKMLIDYDTSSNYGNWTYIAGVGNDPRGGRHFNVEKQRTQYDPNGEYTELWNDLN